MLHFKLTSVEEAELDLSVVHLMPLLSLSRTQSLPLTRLVLNILLHCCFFHRHEGLFFYFIFQKATLHKGLEQSLRPCECYFKTFMQFFNAYLPNKPSDIVWPLPNQGPYPAFLEVGGRPLAWLQLELHHALEVFGGFLHRLPSQLQSMICSLGFCSLLHFLSQRKVLHVLFQCGRPLFPATFVHGTSKHILLLGLK